MADTARKKSSSFDQNDTKDKNIEKGIEKGNHLKQVVKSPKPPLPPRPAGLSKIPPGKKKSSTPSKRLQSTQQNTPSKPPQSTQQSTPSKSPQPTQQSTPSKPLQPTQQSTPSKSLQSTQPTQKKTEDHQNEAHSSPGTRCPPLPSDQVSIEIPGNPEQVEGRVSGEETKTVDKVNKVLTAEKPPEEDGTSKDRSVHQEHLGSCGDAKQVSDTIKKSETGDISQSHVVEINSVLEEEPIEPANTEHTEASDVEITQDRQNNAEQNITGEMKATKPARPSNPRTSSIGSNSEYVATSSQPPGISQSPAGAKSKEITSESKTTSQTPERPKPPAKATSKPGIVDKTTFQTPKRPTPPAVATSGPGKITAASNTGKTSSQTPERPKPPGKTTSKPGIVAIEGNADKTTPQTPKRPTPPAVATSEPGKVTTEGNTGKIPSKTPERPRPPRVGRTSSITNTLDNATPEKPVPPQVPRTPKVAPPIPRKPDSPRGERKSKSTKASLAVQERTQPSAKAPSPAKSEPPVRAPPPAKFPAKSQPPGKSQPPVKPKCPEAASEIVKENNVKMETSGTDIEIPSRDKIVSHSVEHTSSAIEVAVVPETTQDICAVPESQHNDVFHDNSEETLSSDVSIPLEKHPDEASASSEGEEITQKPSRTSEGTVEAGSGTRMESRKDAKPSRPRAPSRKTENVGDDKICESRENSTCIDCNLPMKPAQDGQSCNVVTQVNEEVRHEMSDNVASPKPSRPCMPKHPLELSKPIKDVDRNASEDVKEYDGGSQKNVDKPQRPSKPKLRTGSTSKESDCSSENIVREQGIHKSASISDHETHETVVSVKPQRPSNPKHAAGSTAKESDCSSESIAHEEGIHKSASISDHETHESVVSVKPQRPSNPKHAAGSTAKESDCSSESIAHEEGIHKSASISDHETHESVVSVKPQRPSNPKRAAGSTAKESDCSSESIAHEEGIHKSASISDHETHESVVSVKPQRPSNPKHAAGSTAKESDCSSESIAHEEGIHKSASISDHETHESVVSVKPQRPSNPKHAAGSTAKESDCSSESIAHEEGIHKSASISDHETHESVVSVKPQRPSKPKLPAQSTLEESDCNSESNAHEDESRENAGSVKPKHKPLKPKLPANRESGSEQQGNNPKDEALQHNKIVSNKPSRPAKPDLNLKMPTAHKEEKQGSKIHDIESETSLSENKRPPMSPSRPPNPSNNEITPVEHGTSSTGIHTAKEVTKLAKPPRPHAPLPVHENDKNISVEKELTVETPPKPKRTVMSKSKELDIQPTITPQQESCLELDIQTIGTHQEETISEQPVDTTSETKLLENPPKPERITEDNTDSLNESAPDETEKTTSELLLPREVQRNDNKVGNVANRKAEETNAISGDSKHASCEHSVKVARPPPSSRTSSVQKDQTENVPFIVVKKRSKVTEEPKTVESDKSSEPHPVRFRVSSLSKTQVGSFNKKDFLEKLKNNEKGSVTRDSEEDVRSAAPPVVRPKPSRPRPPPPKRTETSEKDEHEQKFDGHESETSDVTGGDEQAGNVWDKNQSEIADVTSGIADGFKPGNEEESSAGGIGNEKEGPVGGIGNEKERPVGGIGGNGEVECVVSSPRTNTKSTEQKIKRKAPPVPVNIREQHGTEEHFGIEKGVKNDEKKGGERGYMEMKAEDDIGIKRDELQIKITDVLSDVETRSELLSSNIHSADKDSDLKYSDLKDSDLKDSDLKDSDLKDCDLKDCDLKVSTPKDCSKPSKYVKQSAGEGKVDNNNVLEESAVLDTTQEHQMMARVNDVCTESESGLSGQTRAVVDKEEPVVTQVCSLSESFPSGEYAVRDNVNSTEIQTLRENENTNGSSEGTQPCSESAVSDAHGVIHVDVVNSETKSDAKIVVETSKKKKAPPPKPKRTSSLKRESKPILRKTEATNEVLLHAATTEGLRTSSPDVLTEVTDENEEGKQRVSTQTTVIPKEPVVPPTKGVRFEQNIEPADRNNKDSPKPKRPSKPVSRSKSFAPNGKERGNTKESGTKDAPDGLSRSFSFGGKMKRKQPTRPSPPTFFLGETETDDSAKENPESGLEDGEEKNDDVINVEDTSTSQEDLVESETSQNDTKHDMKHDSILTTDSDSENEKDDEPQKSKTYYISREILSTERSFVDVVKLVSEDFREAVTKGNTKFGRAIIPDETLHDIVLNISQIYKFDREFLKALEDRMKTWDEEQRIGDIIKIFSPFLKMYKTYIQGYDNAMAVLTDALKKYPQFAEVVREFECSERCQNLTVGMYMLKPIQRIPSYRLLLMDYLKHLSKDSLDHKDVSDALAIVSEVATHINEDMKRVDNFEEVLKVQRNLVGQVEIVKPGRELIKEGTLMKLCRKDMQPRMFYLLTDILLYTTPVANNQFRLNLSLPLEEIQVEIPVSTDFDNEFSIINTKKSFTLSASTAEERDEWLEALRNASDEIRKKKITFHLAKKEKMEALYDDARQVDEDKAKPGFKAPVWIPDVRVTMCMLCTDDFTVTNRRHHCRACGKVICGSCSSNSAPLPYLNYETARVCDVCHEELAEKTTTSAQAAVAANENGIASDRKNSAPEIKSIRRRFQITKSKEVPAVEESTMSGYLKTRVGKKWQRKWYVVKDHVLYASKASSDVAATETRPLLGYDVRGPEKMDGNSKKIVFQLIHAGTDPVVLQTENMKSAEQWVNELRRATILPP